MKRIVLTLGLCILALSVARAAEPAELLERWQRLRDMDAPAPSFTEAASFLADHPGWPDEKIIRIRAETAAFTDRPDASAMKPFCVSTDPITGRGMFACLRTKLGTPEQRRNWLKKGWVQGDFAESEERSILGEYRTELVMADHSARMERLLYEQKATAAERMLDLVAPERRANFKTRIALTKNDRHALKMLPQGHSDIGVRFARAQQAVNKKDLDALIALVKEVPAAAPYAELWWPLRNLAAREAIEKKHYTTALAIVKNHGDITGEAQAEALWLKGWMKLEFMKDAKSAYTDFHTLYQQVGTPVSRARAAYWAGRAADKNGNPDIAREWWVKAANYPTVFYGQLGHLALKPDAPLDLPAQPEFSTAQKNSFEREELVGAVRVLAANGDEKLCDRFLAHMANNAITPARSALVAALAREVSGIASEVKVAKLALRKQTVMIESGWPRIDLPPAISIEPALALAITRQESEFDPNARSSADARGLMQLLPSTAKHVAKQNEWSYNNDSLDNPDENITLGASYLGQIIDGFDGSYVLGIASYNAGPGSVRRWIADRGMPPKNLTGTLNWIESIPFSETRNYVMRVLENTQVYRTLHDPKKPIRLAEDLTR